MSEEEFETLRGVVKLVEEFCNKCAELVVTDNYRGREELFEEAVLNVVLKCTDLKNLSVEEIRKELGDIVEKLFSWETWEGGSEGGVALIYSPATNQYYYVKGTFYDETWYTKLEVEKYTREELLEKFGN
ncbi:MAG: hypothetical protein MRT15_08965 [archaeon YNP-LCB-003-016]|uniref:hypothetical protein n=1 Tax=Candidatus Culexarchaeum yellowstonense TaxID=2928963 RepID=UPI0026EDA082|nr:hypothetical protein [Candidatus Culexarchaeum yellowstonense]MCR6692509.1 hypothetical protein [Candidatus Culexarchaeum yellowstonense]